MATSGKRCAAIEDTDVVEAEKATLEHVHAFGVLAVHPPSEVEHEFLKHALKKSAVTFPAGLLFNFVDAPRGPCVNRRIHITKRPFVRGQLSVRMHVPFTEEENELFFGEIRIDQRQRDAVKSEIPRGIPRIFP